MASIFDFDGLPPRPKDDPDPPKRSKHREALTPGEVSSGKRRMGHMVEKAFNALEEAILHADHPTSIKAAQILLDRAGFGPKSTVDVNTTTLDLSSLSREELAERASRISAQLRAKAEKPVEKPVTVN